MEARSLQWIAEACGGERRAGAPVLQVVRVTTDSRRVQPGDLFIPLAGERFDGHDFLPQVAAQGAVAALVSRAWWGRAGQVGLPGLGLVTVEDTRRALGQLAARYRADFDLPVVAVGGSNGKTTTKELLASVLREAGQPLWSEASFNNDIGVPLTLLNLERRHTAAVLEAGTNHPGELAPLLRLIQPRHGVLTSIGREHLEFFGDLDGVAREEGALAEALGADGMLFINGDMESAPGIVRRTRARAVQVGLGAHNEWRAGRVEVAADGVQFEVSAPQAAYAGSYSVRLLGRHQVTNALLALAAGAALGVGPEQARRGLAACAPPKMRLQVWEARGVRVLDDAYNANADSMLAALEVLREYPCRGRRVAVLGDMAELGGQTEAAHREVGRRCGTAGVDRLVAVGRWAGETARAARDAGVREVLEFDGVIAAAAGADRIAEPGDVVLLKASRAVGLERLGAALRGGEGVRAE
ncbi:MAG: hypothetical protein RJA22_982 [Verrucomicrobiota bacterium]|jgi:UDP-N-acetylmuramoyl-tripeptide--D-alanyl-D-alanine ligase